MKNLSNYINERLVLSKNANKTLSNVKLKQNEYVIRVGDFYCWWFGVESFDDITKDDIDANDPWFEQVENGSFENQYDVYDFIKDFVDDDNDYTVASQDDLNTTVEVSFELGDVEFVHDCTDFIPANIIIRENK